MVSLTPTSLPDRVEQTPKEIPCNPQEKIVLPALWHFGAVALARVSAAEGRNAKPGLCCPGTKGLLSSRHLSWLAVDARPLKELQVRVCPWSPEQL